MMTAEELLRELSSRLRLGFESQDWGIINANPWRLREFICFYESESLVPSQRFDLADLILASANERLLTGTTKEDDDMQLFVEFIRNHWQEQEAHITYWMSLQSDEEFPITAVLKQIGRVSFPGLEKGE